MQVYYDRVRYLQRSWIALRFVTDSGSLYFCLSVNLKMKYNNRHHVFKTEINYLKLKCQILGRKITFLTFYKRFSLKSFAFENIKTIEDF